LLYLNKMKMNDKLLVGRKIIVPVPGVPPSAVPQKQLKKYKVKDGDTLFSLARSCSITVDELRRLNNMSENDVLLSGSRINLPE
ncbi:MAG TPA: LysM domain-containing protein, partial [Smithellaceae bacterium]|nr:LysM domain-containing protein [Smithellaceae bacterium]